MFKEISVNLFIPTLNFPLGLYTIQISNDLAKPILTIQDLKIFCTTKNRFLIQLTICATQSWILCDKFFFFIFLEKIELEGLMM